MSYLVGAAVAFGVLLLVRLSGMDRDRALYPALLIVTASYYELFAAMGGSAAARWLEAAVLGAFAAAAVIGFRRAPWIIVVGFAAHALFDAVHPLLIDNNGVPAWWPGFCLGFDVVAGIGIAAGLGIVLENTALVGGARRSWVAALSPDAHSP